jgi:hypothetical protein
MFGFYKLLSVYIDAFLKNVSRKFNREVWRFICDTQRLMKYYLEDLRLQRITTLHWAVSKSVSGC